MILASLLFVAAVASAQGDGYPPLVERRIPYDQIPYKIDTIASGRGPQYGYNQCNATTEGPESNCQTGFINSLDDFCLWGLPEPNSSVGDEEARSVAWCTKPGHGTRVIPQGAIKGAQFIQTSQYIQVTGQIDQTLINIAAGDAGGEMDPAGHDRRGNPLGGLLYSTAFNNGTDETPRQIIWWTNFLGADIFCLKACLPGSANEARNCDHVYDRSGCFTNVPSNGYSRTTFEQCKGDVALPVGEYIGANGGRSTWYQPGEGTPIGNLPYNPSTLIPSSSECSSISSLPAAFNGAQPSASASASAVASGSSVSALPSGASASLIAPNRAAQDNSSSGASSLKVPAIALLAAFLYLAKVL